MLRMLTLCSIILSYFRRLRNQCLQARYGAKHPTGLTNLFGRLQQNASALKRAST